MMAICHTAVPERMDGKIIYQAASPGISYIICYYSVCLFTHSNLRSSKFTRLLLDSDVVCDVACSQIFIFNVYPDVVVNHQTVKPLKKLKL